MLHFLIKKQTIVKNGALLVQYSNLEIHLQENALLLALTHQKHMAKLDQDFVGIVVQL